MRNKYVQVISHPTGRILNKRDAYQVNREKLFYLAKETNTYLEINSQPERLDLGDSDARRARDLGVKLVISTDAHDSRSLDYIRYGVAQARRAWLQKEDVLNTFPLEELWEFLYYKKRAK